MDKYSIIDISKGILILLVIVGHLLLGDLEQNIVRYVIYGFHMPVFFIISGWLFKYKKYTSFNIFQMFTKYKNRIIIPWLIAILIYNIICIFALNEGFQFIYYHLWFIPSYLFCVFSVWILSKIRLNITSILLISVIIFLFFQIFNTNLKIYNLIDSYIRPYYLFYFVFGIIMREKYIKRASTYLYLTVMFLVLYTFSFYITTPISRFLLGLPLCLSMSLYVFSNIEKNLNLPFFQWIGVNSMGIYLWHMLPIILAQYLFEDNMVLYYISIIFLLPLFFLLYKNLNKISFIHKYLFGL